MLHCGLLFYCSIVARSKRLKCVYFGAMEQWNNRVILEAKCSIAVQCSIARLSQDEMRLY
jgi:hypothetical protein